MGESAGRGRNGFWADDSRQLCTGGDSRDAAAISWRDLAATGRLFTEGLGARIPRRWIFGQYPGDRGGTRYVFYTACFATFSAHWRR